MIKKNNGTTSKSLTSEDFRRMERCDFVDLKKQSYHLTMIR